MNLEIRNVLSRFLSLRWQLGAGLVLLICIPRFYLVLKANEFGNYSAIGLIMVLSALIPLIILNRNGRRNIGLVLPNGIFSLIVALLIGVLFSLMLYYVGSELYGTSLENWFVYIGKSYNIPSQIALADKQTLFIVMAITGMLFSPVGEEFFFRGIVHRSFNISFGPTVATLLDSTAFAVTHLAHFGIVFIDGKWDLYLVPASIWVISMFLVSLLFNQMKTLCQSIRGAVVCHSGFNLGMTYCIFYLL